jgi:hypothetical protein
MGSMQDRSGAEPTKAENQTTPELPGSIVGAEAPG